MPTYVLIETVTVTSGTPATIVFSAIPQTYDDLLIKMSMRTNESGVYYSDTDLDINSESSRRWNGMYSVNNSAAGSTNTAFNIIGPSSAGSTTASVFSNNDIYIADYKSADPKVVGSVGSQENDSVSNNNLCMMSNRMTNGTNTTTVTLDPFNGTLVVNSCASLYGISKA